MMTQVLQAHLRIKWWYCLILLSWLFPPSNTWKLMSLQYHYCTYYEIFWGQHCNWKSIGTFAPMLSSSGKRANIHSFWHCRAEFWFWRQLNGVSDKCWFWCSTLIEMVLPTVDGSRAGNATVNLSITMSMAILAYRLRHITGMVSPMLRMTK